MRLVDEKNSRRSSLSQFFSPIRHHEQVVRKRAQSLHAQSTREKSILLHDVTSHNDVEDTQTNTVDKKNIKLSISAPLPASSSPTGPTRLDTEFASSLKLPPSSFIKARHHEDPPSSSERKVQFAEPHSLHRERENHHPSISVDASSLLLSDSPALPASSACRKMTPTKRRTVARVSISTGKLYYIQEPIPEYPFPSTCFSPPPSPSRTHHRHHFHSFNFTFRRASQHRKDRSLAGVCSHLRQQSATSGLRYECPIQDHDSCGCGGLQRESESSGTSTPSSTAQSASREGRRHHDREEESTPLYTSASEKFHAHWGMFAFNMRFGMFRAQDRMKDGFAWIRMKTGRQN